MYKTTFPRDPSRELCLERNNENFEKGGSGKGPRCDRHRVHCLIWKQLFVVARERI